jgi:phosphatidylcholine synthase
MRLAPVFLVHLFTAAGAGLGLMAALAVMAQDWPAAFLWLGAALLVDGVDGPIARWLNSAERLPRWDGALLDHVVDYVTYVFVPALILALACGLPGPWAVLAGALVAVSGALYLAHRDIKLADHCFRGFPAVWSMVVFVIFTLQPPPALTLIAVAALTVYTFVPVPVIHPLRVERWRPANVAVFALWLLVALWLILAGFPPAPAAHAVLLAASAYLLFAGAAQRLLSR